jgi:hypothetical protein
MNVKLYLTEKASPSQIVIRPVSGESLGATKKNKRRLSFALGNETHELLCGDSHSIWAQHQETEEQKASFVTVREFVASEGEQIVELGE